MFHFLNSKKKAFTLVEMLVVVTVIAVLSSMVLVGMGGARAKARDARRTADLHNVRNALELYFAKNGVYPAVSGTGIAGWNSLRSAITSADIGIYQVPVDPLNNEADKYYYFYVTNSSKTTYVLGAKLEQCDVVLNTDLDNSDLPSGITATCNDNNANCKSTDTDRYYCIGP